MKTYTYIYHIPWPDEPNGDNPIGYVKGVCKDAGLEILSVNTVYDNAFMIKLSGPLNVKGFTEYTHPEVQK